jgi:hypothetical protein
VDGGVLKAGPLGKGPFEEVSGEVSSATFSPDSAWLLYKRRLAAAASLHLAPVGRWSESKKLGEESRDYSFSPDSKQLAFGQRSAAVQGTQDLLVAKVPQWKPQRVGSGVGRFQFSPDSKWLARIEIPRPEEPGKLWIGGAASGAGSKLGDRVQEFAFSPDSAAIAFLDNYYVPTRTGSMMVADLPDGAPKKLGTRVPFFAWGADRKVLAFSAGTMKPIFSIDLMLYRAGAEPAARISPWVFGYSFAPENQYLFYRSDCVRNGRACQLHALDLRKPGAAAQALIEGVYSFKSAASGERLLVSFARTDSELFDLAVLGASGGPHQTFAQRALLPAYFAAADGSKVVYASADKQRPGVYLYEKAP